MRPVQTSRVKPRVVGASGSGVKALPYGIVLHIGFGSRPDFPSPYAGDAEGLFTAYPWLAGFIAQDFWSQLEPTQGGSLDFSYLDLKVA